MANLFVFFFHLSSKSHCHKSLLYQTEYKKKKKPGESQPEMKCSQKPCHVQMAELCHSHTMSPSSIQTRYPVLTQ